MSELLEGGLHLRFGSYALSHDENERLGKARERERLAVAENRRHVEHHMVESQLEFVEQLGQGCALWRERAARRAKRARQEATTASNLASG